MEYSNSIKIHELEPLYYSANSRVEFRLPTDKVYTNTLRLCNVGVTKSVVGANENYNKLAGVAGGIRSMHILDGNVEIQALTRANEWAAIKHSFKSNQSNNDLGVGLELTRKSALFDLTDATSLQGGTAAATPALQASSQRARGAKIVEGGMRFNASLAGTSDRLTSRGQLDLSDYLGFLQSVNYLDTSVMKDLKLVIEYDVNHLAVMDAGQDTGDLQTTRPLLVVEEIIDPEVVASVKGKPPQAIQYKIIENDIVSVPAITQSAAIPNPIQPQTFHLHAFNNKSVDRMLVKTATTLATTETSGNSAVMYGLYNSHAMLKQKNQVRVNGMNIFARDGISNENERLALHADTWSPNGAIMPYQQGLAFKAPDDTLRTDTVLIGNEAIGSQSYFSCDLAGEKVRDLQLDYERMGFRSSISDAQRGLCKYNSALNLIVFAEVQKAIIFTGSGYNVVYV